MTSAFQKYFGVSEKEIKPDCIVCPVNDTGLFSGFGSSVRAKGQFYSVINSDHASIITTKNNFLVGDCILALDNTECKNIYLFGSCGGIGEVNEGDGMVVERSFCLESFTEMLKGGKTTEISIPDETLVKKILTYFGDKLVSLASCATVSSIMLEKSFIPWFKENNISCADMESSIIFSAAEFIKRKSAALLYVTDNISRGSIFDKPVTETCGKINNTRKLMAQVLCDLIKNERVK